MPRGFQKGLKNSNNAQKWPNSLTSVFPADQGQVGETVQGSVSGLREDEVGDRHPQITGLPTHFREGSSFRGEYGIWNFFINSKKI